MPDSDASVLAELERRQKVKTDREKGQDDEDENYENYDKCEKWMSLHMGLAEQRTCVSKHDSQDC